MTKFLLNSHTTLNFSSQLNILDEPLLGVLGEGDSCGDCGVLEVGLATGDLGCCCCSDAVRLLPILAAVAADVCEEDNKTTIYNIS